MFIRICLNIPLVLAMLFSSKAMALGLGEIEVESSLAAPFLARVRLDNRNSEVFLGSRQVGISLETNLAGDKPSRVTPRLRYRFEKLNTRMPELVIYTRRPVMNPLFNIKVTIDWTEAELSRIYEVIVDPAEYDLTEQNTVRDSSAVDEPNSVEQDASVFEVSMPEQKVFTEAVGEARGQAPAVDEGVIKTFGPTENGSSLWRIALRVRTDNPDLSLYQWMHGLWAKNVDAFMRTNMHLLKTDVFLEVPTDRQVAEVSRPQAYRVYAKHLTELNPANRIPPEETSKVAGNPVEVEPLSTTEPREQQSTELNESALPEAVATTTEPNAKDQAFPADVPDSSGLKVSLPVNSESIPSLAEETIGGIGAGDTAEPTTFLASVTADQSASIDSGDSLEEAVMMDTGVAESHTGKDKASLITRWGDVVGKAFSSGINTVDGIVRHNSGWINIALGSLLTFLVLALWHFSRFVSGQEPSRQKSNASIKEPRQPSASRNKPLPDHGFSSENNPAIRQVSDNLDKFQEAPDMEVQLWEIKTLLGYGRNELAREKLQYAVQTYPENHQFKLLLADLHVQTGDIGGLESIVETLQQSSEEMNVEQLAQFHAVEAELYKHRRQAISVASRDTRESEESIAPDPLAESSANDGQQSPYMIEDAAQQQIAPWNGDTEDTLEFLFVEESGSQNRAESNWLSNDVESNDAVQDRDQGADKILHELSDGKVSPTENEGLAQTAADGDELAIDQYLTEESLEDIILDDTAGESSEEEFLELPDSLDEFESFGLEDEHQSEAGMTEDIPEESLGDDFLSLQDRPKVLNFPDPEKIIYEKELQAFESEVMVTLQAMRDQIQQLNERLFRQERENHELKKQVQDAAPHHQDDDKKEA